MMMSLFSMFDPTALYNFPLNWSIMFLSILVIPTMYWKLQSQPIIIMMIIMNILKKEYNSLFMNNILMKGTILLPISLFFFIMTSNLLSNFPYTFCNTAQLVFSFSLSIPIWTSIILYHWINLTKSMLSHLVPTGTPNLLMPLMVMIELTSNFIRPLALAVRLSANLIAGHLLMALLGDTLNPKSMYWMIILFIQTIFLTFELMVALIQSYVFSVLTTLYSSEIS